jgi:hypothetical protein
VLTSNGIGILWYVLFISCGACWGGVVLETLGCVPTEVLFENSCVCLCEDNNSICSLTKTSIPFK